MSVFESREAVVLVNYGSHALIARNLAPEMVVAAGAGVFVVDNYSSEEERAAIRDLCAEREWHLIAVPTNLGFGAAVNLGVRAAAEAGYDVFVLLNPDATLTESVLCELGLSARREPMALFAPLVDDSSGGKYFHGSMVNLETGQIRGGWMDDTTGGGSWRNWLSGACLAFHWDAFNAIGGMSESYFLYWEDVDFSTRAVEVGVKLVLRTDLRATHDEGGTQTRRNSRAKSNLYYYYNTRNRLLFAKEHLSRAGQRRWLRSTPRQSYQIWLRGGRRQLVEQPMSVIASVCGSFSGAVSLLSRSSRAAPTNATRDTSAHGVTVLLAHPSPDLYGSDRVFLESVSALVSAGFRVVTTIPDQGPLALAIRERGGEVVVCPTPVLRKSVLSPMGTIKIVGETVKSVGQAGKLIKSVKPDLVIVNTVTIPVWMLLGRLARVVVVCHVHEAEHSNSQLIQKGLYASLLLTDHLIVNSGYTLDVLSETWPSLRDRATLIYNGIVGPGSPSMPRSEIGIVRLLFVGRISPRKGPQVAIEALAQLVTEGVSAELSLLGAVYPGYEWFEAELREQVSSRGLNRHVTFLGFDSAIWTHMSNADIVLVPATGEESFGNTAVESVLAMRPAVVSSISGLREAGAGYGVVRFVEPSDSSEIVKAVKNLISEWPMIGSQVVGDRELALSRHAPEVYRGALIRFVQRIGFE